MILAIVFVFGLVIGSFLNVCIARLPHGESIVSPPSRCPRCQSSIHYYDNIPVISFIILRGKCRQCGLPISWQYPLVELANALLYVWTVSEFWIGGETFIILALGSALIVITVIDYHHMIIPDVITIPGMLIGLAVAPFFMTALGEPLPLPLRQLLPQTGPYATALLNSCIGLIAGGGPLFAIGWIWEKLRHEEAMGGGDVKLMGMVGSIIGWKGALLTIFLGAIVGSIVGLTLRIIKLNKRGQLIPFGPFLAVGAVASAFYGNNIIVWYLGLIRG